METDDVRGRRFSVINDGRSPRKSLPLAKIRGKTLNFGSHGAHEIIVFHYSIVPLSRTRFGVEREV